MDQNNILELAPVEIVRPSVSLGNGQADRHQQPFITANTTESSVEEIKAHHIIPVFTKDNETLISHTDFIESGAEIISNLYHGEHILQPQFRLSPPARGRVPKEKENPASQLQEWEKTIYYERMMFIIEIPSIQDTVDGHNLSLTFGGVK